MEGNSTTSNNDEVKIDSNLKETMKKATSSPALNEAEKKRLTLLSTTDHNTIKAYYDVQIDIVSLNGGVLINNARYNFNQYDFNGNDFFNMNFDDILFKLLFTIIGFISPIGITLAIAGEIFGGMIKETMREKSINELIDKFKNQIVGKDYILNIKNAIIKCLEETDKKLSEYSKINIKE